MHPSVGTAGAAVLVFLTGFAVGKLWFPQRRYGLGKPHLKAWLLVINVEFKSVDDRDAFIEHFEPVAAHCAKAEPRTLGYELSIADNDPLKIIIFERYATKADWEVTHREAKAYQALGAWSKSSGIDMVKTGQSYYEADIGYM